MISAIAASLVRVATGCHARGDLQIPDGPHAYIANHTSNLDSLVIWASLPAYERNKCRIVAARDYWTAGPVRRFLSQRVFRTVLIEREKVNRTNNPVRPMCEAIKNGEVLILFPEGTRRDDPRPGAFRSGIYHVALEVPETRFVPTYLENLNRILPKGEVLAVPMVGAIRFGPPISLMPGEKKNSFLDRARDAVLALAAE